MLEKRYDINKFYVGNLYFVKNSNRELDFKRSSVFYNIKDGVYVDLKSSKTYSCYNEYDLVGDTILDFSCLINLKTVFEENGIDYKKHMLIEEVLNKSKLVFNDSKNYKKTFVRKK